MTPEFKSRAVPAHTVPRTFAVIGDPIDHSLSPHLHSAAFRHLGMNDCSYIAYRIPRGELAHGIESLLKIGIAGFNVTIPHKVEVMRHLSKTDETCSMVGAANTVEVAGDGSLKGYNTDVEGFADPLCKRSISLKGASVLLLGAGGAARAVIAALARLGGASDITIANRTPGAASEVAKLAGLAGLPNARAAPLSEADQIARGCNVIINATSIGLPASAEKIIPISPESINRDDVVYDTVYMPMKTDLIQKGKERGATCIMGYEMLLGQAARAFEIWHGVGAPRDAMKRALLGVGA